MLKNTRCGTKLAAAMALFVLCSAAVLVGAEAQDAHKPSTITPKSTTGTARPPQTPKQNQEVWLARVNGQTIGPWEIAARIIKGLEPGATLPEPEKTVPSFVNTAVAREVAMQMAIENGLAVTGAEVDAGVAKEFSDAQGRYLGDVETAKRLSAVGLSLAQFREIIGRDLLIQKYVERLAENEAIPDDLLRARFLETRDLARIKYASFDVMPYYQKLRPTSEETRLFYDSHQDLFKTGETRQVEAILFEAAKPVKEKMKALADDRLRAEIQADRSQYPKAIRASHILVKAPANAGEAALSEARAKAESVLREARQPDADFAALAARYSDDKNSAVRGGDLGFFAPGQMADEFYKAASALQKGAISDVLSTQYGFHIIKLTESDDFGLYRDRVAAAVASREVFAELKLKAEAARKKWLAGGDTSSIAAEFGAEVYLSKPINDDAAVDRRIGRPEGLIKELWSMKPGDVGSVFSIPARVYVPRLKGVNPPGVRAFKDCESDAFESCRYYEAHRLAAEDGKKLAALARQKGDFEAAAKELKAGVAVSNLFTRKGNIDDDIRHQPEIIEDAFNMEIGAIGGPKPFGYREFVYQLAERTKPDMGRFDKEKETIRKELEVKQVRPSFSEMVRVRVDALRKQGRVTVNEGMVKNLVEFAKKTPAIRVQPPEPKPKP